MWEGGGGGRVVVYCFNNNNNNRIQRRCSRFLQSPHSAANCLQHVRAIVCKSRATHRALIMCNMLCYEPLGTKGQLSIKFDRVEIAFI